MNVMDKCLITTAIFDILDNVRMIVSYYRPPTTPSYRLIDNRWQLSFTLRYDHRDILETRELHIVSFLTTLFEEKEKETAEVKQVLFVSQFVLHRNIYLPFTCWQSLPLGKSENGSFVGK